MLPAQFPIEQIKETANRLKVEDFYRRFVLQRYPRYGDGHFVLACYAAFPAFISPDLLYYLWLNFGKYLHQGEEKQIHRVAVSDVLLSPLFREVQYELYEMPVEIRNAFLAYIQTSTSHLQKNNGIKDAPLLQLLYTIEDVAKLLLQYINQIHTNTNESVYELQWWTATSYLDPRATKEFLTKRLKDATNLNMEARYARAIRDTYQRYEIGIVKDPNAVPLDFKNLADFATAHHNILFGKTDIAEELFNQLAAIGAVSDEVKPGMVALKVHENVASKVEIIKADFGTEIQNIYLLTIGIDEYLNASIPKLRSCVSDASKFADCIGEWTKQFNSQNPKRQVHLVTTRIFNANATRIQILEQLNGLAYEAKEKDAIYIYYAGHGRTKIEGIPSLILHDSGTSNEQDLNANELKEILEKRFRNIEVHLILDMSYSGGEEWIDSQNKFHAVWAPCQQQEVNIETKGGGVFTTAICNSFINSPYQTIRVKWITILKEITEKGRTQHPQFFGHPSALNKLVFLQNNRIAELQTLLRQTGFYHRQTTGLYDKYTKEALENFKYFRQIEDEASAKMVIQDLKKYKEEYGKDKPPIFLMVFSNVGGTLPQVKEEAVILEELFKRYVERTNIELLVLNNPTLSELEKVFKNPNTRNRIHLFHFAGTERNMFDTSLTNEIGFCLSDQWISIFDWLQWIDFQENIKLAYVNTCNSNYMADFMAQLGIAFAIGIDGIIRDNDAKENAIEFYESWFNYQKNTISESFKKTLSTKDKEKIDLKQHRSGRNSIFNFKGYVLKSYPWSRTIEKITFNQYLKEEGIKNYLLVIAIDNYIYFPRLYNPVRDAIDIAKVLTDRYQFSEETLISLYDEQATQKNIFANLDKLSSITTDKDNLLIFFSGHGEYKNQIDEGFWIPYDGEPGNVGSYIPFSVITRYIKAIKSLHTFVIADSAYSGSLFTKK